MIRRVELGTFKYVVPESKINNNFNIPQVELII